VSSPALNPASGPAIHPACGHAPLPDGLLHAFTLEPGLLAALAAAGGLGAWCLARTAAEARRRGAFGVAGAAALVAFVSPLCALTVALFAARTLHHLVLLGLLAPALAVAFPIRRAPLGAGFAALSAALWAWHVPAVYAAAWDSAAVYWALTLALVLPAWAFWSAVLAPRGGLAGPLAGAAALAGLSGQMGLIGALLVFAPAVLYPEHLAGAEGFGLTALADQQLAGLVMWVPGMLPLLTGAMLLLRRGWHAVAA
jgi:putative membrane protein